MQREKASLFRLPGSFQALLLFFSSSSSSKYSDLSSFLFILSSPHQVICYLVQELSTAEPDPALLFTCDLHFILLVEVPDRYWELPPFFAAAFPSCSVWFSPPLSLFLLDLLPRFPLDFFFP